MRLIRYAIILAVAIFLIAIALANRGMTTVRLVPAEVAQLSPINPSIELPLFAIIFAGIAVGLLLGYGFEWLREWKHRSSLGARDREVRQLKREMRQMKKAHGTDDDVLSILDDPR
ncbi:MAG: LapA family protein [Pseudomonadota bacterium]